MLQKIINADELIHSNLQQYNIVSELLSIKEHGRGAGEYSIASLLTGLNNPADLKSILTNQNTKHDISIPHNSSLLKFEVKAIKTLKANARANSHSNRVISHITTILDSIYNRLEFIFTNANENAKRLYNEELTKRFNLPIDIMQLILHAQEKIKSENYSRVFLGLDKQSKKNKINLLDLLLYIEEIAKVHHKFTSEVVKDVNRIVNMLESDQKYNLGALDSCLKFALLKSLRRANFDVEEISSLIIDIKLDFFLTKLHNYINEDLVTEVLEGDCGIFFIVLNEQQEFFYIPNHLFKKYIEFAGISQSVLIRLNLAAILP